MKQQVEAATDQQVPAHANRRERGPQEIEGKSVEEIQNHLTRLGGQTKSLSIKFGFRSIPAPAESDPNRRGPSRSCIPG